MFQFGLNQPNQPNQELTYYSGLYNELQGYRQLQVTQNQTTLHNLKIQNETLF